MKYTFVKYDQLCHSERSNEIAKSKNLKVGLRAVLFATLFLAACGDDNKNAGGTVEDGEVVAIVDKTISGVSQKGPFLNGSSVTVQELDGETLAQTGLGFEGKIKNDLGEFTVKVNKLESQYALLKANGFYRNEVTGEKSKSQITLYALTDLSNRDEVNVNLLTHLAYERSLYLATVDTLSVAKAKKQAESEIFKSFGIEGDFAAAEDLNIFGADDQSAALLAVSILMQSDLSEGDFSERLADYAADIESDGIWNDAKTATEIADWASNRSLTGTLTAIRNNIAGWGLSADVPAFEMYVNNFWWQNYGLGICDAKREGEVLKNQNTASVNADVYYICKSNSWQVASDIEKDTYKWLDPAVKHTEKDGDVRYGDVVKTNCYVFEDKTWRSGNANDCSLELRGCTALRQDTVGLGVDSVWYICDEQNWREASTVEFDTYQIECSENGIIVNGRINVGNKYVCDGGIFRAAAKLEINADSSCTSYNRNVFYILPYQHSFYKCTENGWVISTEKKNQGTMVDERDGKVYKTVWVDNQLWMAENLNYADSVNYPSMLGKNWCLNDKDSCDKYGRYYTWTAAIDYVYWSKQGKTCRDGVIDYPSTCVLPDTVQGICPKGWHIPNIKEWEILDSTMTDESYRSDAYNSISAIPSCYSSYSDIHNCDEAYFWSSTIDNNHAVYWGMDVFGGRRDYGHNDGYASNSFSVRCIKDSE